MVQLENILYLKKIKTYDKDILTTKPNYLMDYPMHIDIVLQRYFDYVDILYLQ